MSRASYRRPYSVSRASGVTRGLDGAIQRVVVNGHAVEHLMERATDSAGVSRYEVSDLVLETEIILLPLGAIHK